MRAEQEEAKRHLAADHRCDDPHCSPYLVRRWLEDAFYEELEVEYGPG